MGIHPASCCATACFSRPFCRCKREKKATNPRCRSSAFLWSKTRRLCHRSGSIGDICGKFFSSAYWDSQNPSRLIVKAGENYGYPHISITFPQYLHSLPVDFHQVSEEELLKRRSRRMPLGYEFIGSVVLDECDKIHGYTWNMMEYNRGYMYVMVCIVYKSRTI